MALFLSFLLQLNITQVYAGSATAANVTEGHLPEDLALATAGATYTARRKPWGGWKHNSVDPQINDGRLRTGCDWARLDTPLVLTFPRVVTINKVEIVFRRQGNNWYHFTLESSTDSKNWQTIATKQQDKPRGYQVLIFPERQCRHLRLTVLKTSNEQGIYEIEELAAYHQSDPAQPTPLLRHLRGGPQLFDPRNDQNHLILHQIFGPKSVVSDELREKLLKSPADTQIFEDLDADGDPDIVTYLDNDKKHQFQPILVRVIDDDDDMTTETGPDKDSDCYVVDWFADGLTDRIVDYWDFDHDGDLDRMDLISRRGLWFEEKIGLIVVEDISDDNRLYYTQDYEYTQPECQWQSDFNGDQSFSMYFYDTSRKQFVPLFEDPFAHYDIDSDSLAEVTVRIDSTEGNLINTARYSCDVDNDTDRLNRRDYDFSFTLAGPIELTEAVDWRDKLYDGSFTNARVHWRAVREVVETASWKSNTFCWDEIDNNVWVQDKFERWHERWEGVGGYPGCVSWGNLNENNKRWEKDSDYSGKMQLYYSPIDRRIHLYGAEAGAINIDYDFDNKTDTKFTYSDTDNDGFFDTWSYDTDADGKPDRTYKADAQPVPVRLRYPEITNIYRSALAEALEQNQQLIDVMKLALGEDVTSGAEDWFVKCRPSQFYNPEKLLSSDEARRYYQDLIREDLFTQLLARIETGVLSLPRAKLEAAYSKGRFTGAAQLICASLNLVEPSAEPWLDLEEVKFQKRLRIRLTNPIDQDRASTPVVIPIKDILKVAPDFNPACFAVAETKHRIVTAQFPSQADDLNGDGQIDEIVFLLKRLPKGQSRQCFIYYSPHGRWAGNYRKQTRAQHILDESGNISASIGWESELIGFRSYYGKFDFFGKKLECLRLDNLGDYHEDADWGMDVLHVGSAPGIGGISLWVGDQIYRAYNEEAQPPRCEIKQRVVADGPVRSAIRLDIAELKVDQDIYSFSVIASVYAGQLYSEHCVIFPPSVIAQHENLSFSGGIVRIPNARILFEPGSGLICTWGSQYPHAPEMKEAGYIGQAIIAHPTEIIDRQSPPDSEELLLRIPKSGQVTFFVAAEWEKSRTDQRRLVADTGSEWEKHARRLAERLRYPVAYEILALQTKSR